MKYEQGKGKGKNRANEPERESSRKGHKYAIIIWTRECGCAYACHFYHTHTQAHTHGHTMQSCGCIINAKLLHLLAVHGTVIDMQLSSIVRCTCVRALESMQQHSHADCMRNESFIPKTQTTA